MKAPVKFVGKVDGQEVEMPFEQAVEVGLQLPPDNPLHAMAREYATKLKAIDRYPPTAHGKFSEAAEKALLKAAEVGLKFAEPKVNGGRKRGPVRRYMATVIRAHAMLPVPGIVAEVLKALRDEDEMSLAAQDAGVSLKSFEDDAKVEIAKHRKAKNKDNTPLHQFVRRVLAE